MSDGKEPAHLLQISWQKEYVKMSDGKEPAHLLQIL